MLILLLIGYSLAGLESGSTSTSGTTVQTGVAQSGAGQAEGVAAPSAIVAPSPRSAMNRAVYLRRVTVAETRVLKLMARAAAIGAGGRVATSTFGTLLSRDETTMGAWSQVTPPAGLESFD